MNTEQTSSKWYDNKPLLIIFFFLLPPLGVIGIIKRKTDLWKKIVYIFPASFLILITVVSVIGALMMDNYKIGVDYYKKQDYEKAYNSFNLVSSSNENYNDAIIKMKEIKPFVDSIQKIKELNKIAERKVKEQQKLEKQRQKELKENPSLAFPTAQQNLLKVLEQTEIEYENAPNELKKSLVRTKRGKLIKKTLKNSRNFIDWVGVVSDMQTTTKRNAVFEIEIENTGITISTFENELLDLMGRNTLISPKNQLYGIISELEKGDRVIVSGSFIPSDKVDYIYESSLTESGSMRSPEFNARFTKVTKQ